MTDARWFRIRYLALSLLLIALSNGALAASILFVTEDSPALQRLVPALQRSFQQTSNVIKVAQSVEQAIVFTAVEEDIISTEENGADGRGSKLQPIAPDGHSLGELCQQADVVVIAGSRVARPSLLECQAAKLLVFVPRRVAEGIVASASAGPVSAIYLEADPIRNLRLIRRALANAARVAVLVSPNTEPWLPRLQEEAERLGLALVPVRAADDEQAVHRLRERLGNIDALLLLPDERLVNAWSLKPILLMTARSLVPVFGGSVEGYVKAGVTAAVVQDFERAGAQIKRLVRQLAGGEVPEPSYPEATRLVVNELVAGTLSVPTDHLEGADAQ